MDSKFFVSYEAARLLKEKGYDRECMAYYQNDEFRPYSLTRSGISMYNKNDAPSYMNQYSAPSKSEAIDWLESKGIVLETLYAYMEGIYFYTVYYNNEEIDVPSSRRYKTRLEAEDAAIIKALQLLK